MTYPILLGFRVCAILICNTRVWVRRNGEDDRVVGRFRGKRGSLRNYRTPRTGKETSLENGLSTASLAEHGINGTGTE
jgi:hypothetical protein